MPISGSRRIDAIFRKPVEADRRVRRSLVRVDFLLCASEERLCDEKVAIFAEREFG